MKFLLVLAALVGATAAVTGFDAIQAMSSSTFTCLKNAGYEFYIARVWESVGRADETGIANIKHARAAGWKYVDGYIFPCLSSRCPSPAQQMKDVVARVKAEGAQIGMYWLDIERLNWSTNLAHNQQIIIEMGNELTALGVNWGIYSNYYMWEEIVGLNWNHFAHKQLWWADYNGQPGFGGYRAFGGWSKPAIHQWKGTHNGGCGVSMDANYY